MHATLCINDEVYSPNLLIEARGFTESSAEALQQCLIYSVYMLVIVLVEVVLENILAMKLVRIFARDLSMWDRFSNLQVDEVVDSIYLVYLLKVLNVCLNKNVSMVRFKVKSSAHASFVCNAEEGV